MYFEYRESWKRESLIGACDPAWIWMPCYGNWKWMQCEFHPTPSPATNLAYVEWSPEILLSPVSNEKQLPSSPPPSSKLHHPKINLNNASAHTIELAWAYTIASWKGKIYSDTCTVCWIQACIYAIHLVLRVEVGSSFSPSGHSWLQIFHFSYQTKTTVWSCRTGGHKQRTAEGFVGWPWSDERYDLTAAVVSW